MASICVSVAGPQCGQLDLKISGVMETFYGTRFSVGLVILLGQQ
jgi:hypothetical protein